MPDHDEIRRRIVDQPRDLTEETARRLIDTLDRTGALAPIRRIRSSEIASAILGAVGSIAVGLVLLAVTGALLTRLRGH